MGTLKGSRRVATKRPAKPRVELTQRQHDVAILAASGKTYDEIAVWLSLATPTIRHHLDAVLGKLGIEKKRQLHDRLEQVRVVIKKGRAT